MALPALPPAVLVGRTHLCCGAALPPPSRARNLAHQLVTYLKEVHRSMRLLTHWNPEHVPQNAAFSSYRPIAPSSQPAAVLPPMEAEKVHNIVYYTRDKARSRTQEYPTTLGGLSARHPLTKSRVPNASPAAPAHLPKQLGGKELSKLLDILK